MNPDQARRLAASIRDDAPGALSPEQTIEVLRAHRQRLEQIRATTLSGRDQAEAQGIARLPLLGVALGSEATARAAARREQAKLLGFTRPRPFARGQGQATAPDRAHKGAVE